MGKRRKLSLAVFMCVNLIMSSVIPVYASEDIEVIEGAETVVTEKTENVQEITLDVIPGETDTKTSIPEPTKTIGDLKEDENDQEYNQTTISETERQVTLTTEEIKIKEGIDSGEASLTSPIPNTSLIDVDVPEKDIQKHAYSPTVHDSGNPGNYEYRYTGYGQESSIGVNKIESNSDTLAHHFELTDTDNEESKQYVYCSDYVTTALRGYYYDIENLEQSSYYSEDDKEHIRAIAEYAYWGTESGYGSLESLKNALEADVLKGKLEDFGIDDLTEGEALTASQAAIWYYAKGGNSVDYTDPAGSGVDTESSDRVKALVDYLLTLTKTREDADATQIIDDKNFLKPDSMKLTVKDKVWEAAENKDDDDTNDQYNAEISFALTVIPNTVTDDLLVIITDGNVVKTARIAGVNKEDETYEILNPEQNGCYIIRDIKLNEGKTVFDLKLRGTQYLERGVYIYTSENYNETNSQTFVGIAEGTRDVDVSMQIEFDLAVDEAVVTAVHEWKQVKMDPIEDPEEDPGQNSVKITSTIPKTGDTSNTMLLLVMIIGSIGVIGTVSGYIRRKNF